MKNKNAIYFLLFVLVISACNKKTILEDVTADHFFFENNDAIMPVFVEGKTSSKSMMILLHGGPGGEDIIYKTTNIFEEIEKKHRVVYWDQRCAGSSQGNCDPKEVVVADYVDDLNNLITILKNKYGEDLSFFLLGHSWGGTFALSYLIDGNNQSNLNGAIITGGPHNFPLMFRESQIVLTHFANQQIEAGNNKTEWEKLKKDVNEVDLASITVAESGVINSRSYISERLLTDVDSITKSNLTGMGAAIFSSPSDLFATTMHNYSGGHLWKKIYQLDMTDDLSKITIPIAIYSGRYDHVIPPASNLQLFDTLGSVHKELFFFEKSAHSAMYNEPTLYNEKVNEFIEMWE